MRVRVTCTSTSARNYCDHTFMVVSELPTTMCGGGVFEQQLNPKKARRHRTRPSQTRRAHVCTLCACYLIPTSIGA